MSPSGTAVHVRWQCGSDYVQGFVRKLKVIVSLSETADPLLKSIDWVTFVFLVLFNSRVNAAFSKCQFLNEAQPIKPTLSL